MSDKLLPCPFCGSTDVYIKLYDPPIQESWGIAEQHVVCSKCKATGPIGEAKYEDKWGQVSELWNTRAED